MRTSVGLWLGFLLALPIPVLAASSSAPRWIVVVSLTAPFVWAVVVGAAARVAHLGDVENARIVSEASTAGESHAAESAVLRGQAAVERTGRKRVESVQRLADVELTLAQRVHRSLLPEDIARPDLTVVVRQIPCSYIGGDYLHAVLARPDLLYLCVGDVSGHGVSAALVVSRLHGLVQRSVLRQRTPAEILEDVDRSLVEIVRFTDLYLTFCVFRVDLTAQRIDYATAGHPAQFLVRGAGGIESLITENGILGTTLWEAPVAMRSQSVDYEAGDTLVLFTDGLFEVAARDGGGMLGEEGIRAGLEELARESPESVASELLRRATEFGNAGAFEDDLSLMVVRLGGVADDANGER